MKFHVGNDNFSMQTKFVLGKRKTLVCKCKVSQGNKMFACKCKVQQGGMQILCAKAKFKEMQNLF